MAETATNLQAPLQVKLGADAGVVIRIINANDEYTGVDMKLRPDDPFVRQSFYDIPGALTKYMNAMNKLGKSIQAIPGKPFESEETLEETAEIFTSMNGTRAELNRQLAELKAAIDFALGAGVSELVFKDGAPQERLSELLAAAYPYINKAGKTAAAKYK